MSCISPQIQNQSVDTDIRMLIDLDDLNTRNYLDGVGLPELIKVVNNVQSNLLVVAVD